MERSFPTPTPPRLDLRVPAGQITVETDDGADETSVDLEGPAEALENATVEQRGDTVVVEVRDRKGLLGVRSAEVYLRVRCPDGAAATVRTKSADLVVRGLLERLDAATASGDLLADRVAGEASLKSASGDLRLGDVGGDVSLNTASGDAAVGRIGGALRANLVSGDLEVRAVGGAVAVNTVSGDVEVGSVREGEARLQSVSGDVEVGIRRGSRVHVDASTLSGDTRSELDLGDDPAAEDGPLVELRVKTVSGDVSVVRATQEVHQS